MHLRPDNCSAASAIKSLNLQPQPLRMRSRNVIVTLVLLVSIFLFAILKRWQEPQRQEAFDRTPEQLRFYAFALCRMQCLGVSEAEIRTILQAGVINLNRSNRRYRPCPIFAVQGRVRSGYLRVVFEQCRNGTYVANCYNLERDITCDCATDYKPKNK
jgi:hypothetical protein